VKWGAIAVVAGAGLIAFSQVALGALLVVVGVGLIALDSIKRVQQDRPDAIEDDVKPADRHLLAPIRKQLAKIEDLVRENADHAGIKVIGSEALQEGQSIYRQCVALVLEKANERKIKAQLAQVQRDKAAAEQKLSATADSAEKDLYQTAIDSYLEQERLLADRQTRFQAIEAQLAQAESALKLIVAQMSTMAHQGANQEESGEELRQSLSRLQALGQSLGETGEFLENMRT